jgi:pantothenate kinase-related protein Tda10
MSQKSKTQEKRAQRQAEADAFVKERRKTQISIFEQNFDTGMRFYLENKDKMSEEEQALIEVEIEKNRKVVEEFKEKWNV